MIVRLVLCLCLISFVRALEWQSYSVMSGSPRPPGKLDTNVDSAPDFQMGFNPFIDGKVQVPSKHKHLFEVTSQNTRCYTFKSMIKLVRGILAYLSENPGKINYLHHLIGFVNDDVETTSDAYDSNQFSGVFSIIERDETLPHHEKKVLRELLNMDVLNPDIKTRIEFEYELPSLNQPNCKNVLMELMETAHNKYMQLANYPTCQMYNSSNIDQPELPKGDRDFPNPSGWSDIFDGIKSDDNKPIINPDNSDLFTKIQYILGKIKEGSYDKQPDKINDILTKITISLNGLTNDPNRNENWPGILPDVGPIPISPNYETTPKNIIDFDITPKPIVNIPPNGEMSIDAFLKYLLPFLTHSDNNLIQNPKLIEAILAILKTNNHDVTYSKIIKILELLQSSSEGHMDPKLIEIILPLLVKTKNAPDPKVIEIIITLLKHKVQSDVNPKITELILSLLKLNRDDVSKDKYQILLSLLHPDENGEVNPKLIEIISSLLKVNENSTPNDKIIQTLVTFFNLGNGLQLNQKSIDSLLYLLKLNDNHRLPEQLYNQIIQFLYKLNVNKKTVPDINSIYYYYVQPGQSQKVDGNLLALLLAKNPLLINKLLPGQYAAMPSQMNTNVPGVIELTYLLKHPKPFVYQPFYYVKYKLPLPTFVANVRNLLLKNPRLTSNPTKLYQDLIKISNVTEISPNLQGYSKDDILKLTFENGALVKTNIMDDKSVNFKEQINLLQDLNSEVLPESILEQTKHIWNDQKFKDEHKLDGLLNVVHPENLVSPLTNFGNSQIPGLEKLPFQWNVGGSNIGQTDVIWQDTLRKTGQGIKKE